MKYKIFEINHNNVNRTMDEISLFEIDLYPHSYNTTYNSVESAMEDIKKHASHLRMKELIIVPVISIDIDGKIIDNDKNII